MESYLNFLSNQGPTNIESRVKIKSIIEKGKQIFRDSNEFNLWLNKSVLNLDRTLFDSNKKHIDLDFISDEMDRLAQGYCV
ncbi:MAG: hypothetical protein ABIN24_09650 [Dyadobacter sp.]